MTETLSGWGAFVRSESDRQDAPGGIETDRHDTIRTRCESPRCSRWTRAGRRWCDAECQQDARSL